MNIVENCTLSDVLGPTNLCYNTEMFTLVQDKDRYKDLLCVMDSIPILHAGPVQNFVTVLLSL